MAAFLQDSDEPCSITALTAGDQAACNPETDSYNQDVTITYSYPPSSGTVNVNGQSFPITNSPQTVTLTGLNANGQPVNVSAIFSSEPSCSLTQENLFTAPQPCTQSSIVDSVLVADKEVILTRHAIMEGDIFSNGKITYKPSNNSSIHDGTATAVGKVKIQTGNTVNGDVISGSTVDNSGDVMGIIIMNAPVSPKPMPNLSFSAGSNAVTVPKRGRINLAPGNYGNVKVSKKATLVLSSGAYYMKSLSMQSTSILDLDVSSDSITVNIMGLLSSCKKYAALIFALHPSREPD